MYSTASDTYPPKFRRSPVLLVGTQYGKLCSLVLGLEATAKREKNKVIRTRKISIIFGLPRALVKSSGSSFSLLCRRNMLLYLIGSLLKFTCFLLLLGQKSKLLTNFPSDLFKSFFNTQLIYLFPPLVCFSCVASL